MFNPSVKRHILPSLAAQCSFIWVMHYIWRPEWCLGILNSSPSPAAFSETVFNSFVHLCTQHRAANTFPVITLFQTEGHEWTVPYSVCVERLTVCLEWCTLFRPQLPVSDHSALFLRATSLDLSSSGKSLSCLSSLKGRHQDISVILASKKAATSRRAMQKTDTYKTASGLSEVIPLLFPRLITAALWPDYRRCILHMRYRFYLFLFIWQRWSHNSHVITELTCKEENKCFSFCMWYW